MSRVQHYLTLVDGLFGLRAATTLSQEAEGEIAEAHDHLWRRMGEAEQAEVEAGIEALKAKWGLPTSHADAEGLHDCTHCGKEDSETINGCDLCGECRARVQPAIDALDALTPEYRCSVFAAFCVYCGDDDPVCQCTNDE